VDLHSELIDPSPGDETARKRGKSNSRRAAERAEWKKLGLDLEKEKERYLRDILPKLKDFSIMDIRRDTGFSPRYASLIRRGLYVPHPAHYEALRNLVDYPQKINA
jgi:hypothetical protein